jgi:hypothetical protein
MRHAHAPRPHVERPRCAPRPAPAAPPGQGASDFVDALIVAADALVGDLGELSAAAAAGPRAKDPSASIRRRFVLLSNFLSPHTKGDPTGEVAAQLTGAMQAHAVSLEVVSLDAAAADAEGAGAKALNSRLLDAVCAEVEHSLRSVRHPDDLRALWPAHEFAGRALGLDLHIGSGARRLRIPVKFSNKAMRQSYPAMGKETPPAGAKAAGGGEEGDGGGEGGAPAAPRPSMARDTEFFRDDDEAQLHPIPAGERVRAYRVRGGLCRTQRPTCSSSCSEWKTRACPHAADPGPCTHLSPHSPAPHPLHPPPCAVRQAARAAGGGGRSVRHLLGAKGDGAGGIRTRRADPAPLLHGGELSRRTPRPAPAARAPPVHPPPCPSLTPLRVCSFAPHPSPSPPPLAVQSPISVWADTKGSPKPGEALAALVAALEAQGQVAILRCVFRNKNVRAAVGRSTPRKPCVLGCFCFCFFAPGGNANRASVAAAAQRGRGSRARPRRSSPPPTLPSSPPSPPPTSHPLSL